MTSKHQQAGLGELFIASNPLVSAADTGPAADSVPELALNGERKEIVFIIDDVADIDTLVQGFGSGREVFVLDANQDGLRQMAELLEERNDIAAMHVISHGKEGSVSLGTSVLEASTMTTHAAELQAIGRSMASGGDILFYGCDVGASADGLALVSALSKATGADVAASDDLTGAVALGGDWELEIRSGNIDSLPVVSPELASLYQQTLAIPSFNIDFSYQAGVINPGGLEGGAYDVVYQLNHPSSYRLQIDGATQSVYAGAGYILSDMYRGGETSIDFSFQGGQVFSPTSINVRSAQNGFPAQKLVFRGYDADNQLKGGPVVVDIPVGGGPSYVPVALSGLEGIATLRVKADPGSNGGKMFVLEFDDFSVTNIRPAGPPEPKVTSVSSTAVDGAYGVGAEIFVTVTFDQDVAVAGGRPTLQLETGSTDRLAVYEDGSGSNTLRFKYTVQAGDTSSDLNYFSTGSLSLAGATIKGSNGGADASLVLPALNSPDSLGGGKAIVIDSTAPTLAITSSHTGTLKVGDTAVITFTFSEVVSGFERGDVDVTGGLLGSLTRSQDGRSYSGTFTPDANQNSGSATITVIQGAYTDIAGNPGGAGVSPSITFDTLAPAQPLAAVLHPDSDSGAIGDGITSDDTPTFSGATGSVEGGATVRVYAGATLIAQTTANANGSWTATSTTPLDDASYQITVRARDAAENDSVRSDAFTLVVDTAAPKTPARPDLAPGSDSGIDNDNITNALTQTVGGAANSVEGGSLVTLYRAGVPIAGATTTAADDGSWSIDLNLTDGQYTITARSTDKAGNQGGASDPLALTVDHQAPAAPQAPLLHADSNSGSKADTITSDRTPTFYGENGSVEGGATVNLYADGKFIGSTVAAANGSWSLAVNQLDTGTYAITAEAVDRAGNVSIASSGTSVTIDYAPPAAQVDKVKFSDDSGVLDDDFVTSEANQTVSGIVTAPLEQGEWVGVSIDNGVSYAAAVVAADGVAWSHAGVQIAGKGTLMVRVFDAAGNAGEPFSHAYEHDAVAPGKPSVPDLTLASDSGDDHEDNITGVTMPTFTGTAEKDATITLYADGKVVGSGKADADGKWSVTVDEALEGGSYDFTVSATDRAGNEGDASDALAVTIITAAPGTENLTFTLSADSGIDSDRVTNVADQTLEGTLSAALASGEKVEVYLDGKWRDTGAGAGDTTWSLGASLEEGKHQVEVRVLNAIGNAGPVGKYAYTLDTAAPTVAITSDKPTLKAGETATITFTFSDDPGAAFSKDAVKVTGGTLSEVSGSGLERTAVFTPSANQNSGSAGISIDAGVFTDLAGNASESASLTTLTFDTLAPAAPSTPVLDLDSDTGVKGDGITSDNRPTFVGTAESGATVTLYDANGNPIGSGKAVDGVWTIAPTNALAEGKHVVSARAVDEAGNESEATTGVEVTIDRTPPTLSIGSNVATLKSGETATITFTFSEDPGDSFTKADIQLSGGTLGDLTRDGLKFTATFTPNENVDTTTASITVGAGAYVDVAGNNGGPGLSPTLAFDTKAPVAPSIPDLVDESDTGSANDDDITGDTTPTFSGTAEAGATVTLFADGQAIGSVVATDGTWRITSDTELKGGKYAITAGITDAMGNPGPASKSLEIEIVTDAPTTRATSLKFSADTGGSPTDLVTKTAAQTISGALDAALKAGEYVEVSVDGNTWKRASIDEDGWSIAATLVAGEQAVAVRVVNAIGNAGEEYSRDYRLDTLAPSVTISSNVSELKRGENATITFTFSEDPGATFTWDGAAGDVVVSGGALSAISGSGSTRTATFTPADGFEGNASITVAASSYADLAGNLGANGATPVLAIDTRAPDAPDVPKLAADSDTGEKGDGRTESTTQVIEGGGAEPGAMVYLYNGNQQIGSGQANAEGLWSIDVALGAGTYALSVTQDDEAGNESAKSDPFQLTVTVSNPNPNPNPDPEPQPNPPTVIDGMPVTTAPVTLPGGVRGTNVAVPIVTGSRNETDGQVSLADIPLATSGGQTQLLAQLPVGYGLSTSGASVGAASGLEFLIASIRAATPTHAPDDQGHLVQNGTSFLQGLSYSSLLVHTVKPVSNPGTTGALVLTGSNPGGAQGTALVIETAGLANDATIDLVDIDFAALVGATTVSTGGSGAILAGDGASQHFTVLAGGNNDVFSGGGSDLLTFAAAAPVDPGSANGRASAQQVAAGGATTLHGGQGGDAASFAGARADYDVDVHNGYLVVSSKAAPDAKALVVNVEELRFADGNVAVENGAGLSTLAGMYQTVFGRQADLYGFEFWADHRDNGISWGTIALELIASSERLAQHGDFNGDSANDVGLLYQALFNREADAAGLAFWQAAMDERGMTLEQVATSFVESAEMVGHQRGALDWDFLV